MQKVFILKNMDNGKYYTGTYRDDFWSKSNDDAKEFQNDYEIKREMNPEDREDSQFEDIKMIEVVTVYTK